MDKLNKESLEFLKTDVDTCLELVKELSANYNSKIHYPILTQSVVSSINAMVNGIIHSRNYLEGYYIMCDEIDPIKLTNYLFKLKQFDVNKEVVSYYVSFYLKRKINSFYKGLKEDKITMGVAMFKDKRGIKKFYKICNERSSNGLKLLKNNNSSIIHGKNTQSKK